MFVYITYLYTGLTRSRRPIKRPPPADNSSPEPPLKTRNVTDAQRKQHDLKRCQQYITAINSVPQSYHRHSNLLDFLRLLIQCEHTDLGPVRGSLKRFIQEKDTEEWVYKETREAAKAKERETYTNVLAKELEAVGKQPMFGRYDALDIQVAITTEPKDFHAGIQTAAPTLCALLKILCKDRRTDSPKLPSRIAAILQIMLFTRNQRKHDFQQAVMGLIFHSKGVSKTLFTLLHALGITASYDTVLATVQGLHAEALKAIEAFVADGRWLVAYDNLDLSIDTHEQTVQQYANKARQYVFANLLYQHEAIIPLYNSRTHTWYALSSWRPELGYV
jgi:hypothetical protein